MRLFTGGVSHIAPTIEDVLTHRLFTSHTFSALSDLSACVLTCRNANTGDWISVLPRKVEDDKSKERYISRVLSNRLIDPFDVMKGFIPEIIEMMSEKGQTIILMIDQSKVSSSFGFPAIG